MNGPEVQFEGRLGADPELRYSQSGTAWVSFSVAADKVGPKKDNGERDRVTTWFKVKAFNQQAEHIASTLAKGASVIVRGNLELDKWEGSDGKERTDMVCIADTVGLNLRWSSAVWTAPERSENSNRSQQNSSPASSSAPEPVYGEEEPF